MRTANSLVVVALALAVRLLTKCKEKWHPRSHVLEK